VSQFSEGRLAASCSHAGASEGHYATMTWVSRHKWHSDLAALTHLKAIPGNHTLPIVQLYTDLHTMMRQAD
jgi:hypothetical protein